MFDALSPIGGLRMDVNAGRIAQAIAIHSGHCRTVPDVLECALQFDLRRPEPTPEQAEMLQHALTTFRAQRLAAQARAAQRRAAKAAEAKRLAAERREAKRGNHRQTRNQT